MAELAPPNHEEYCCHHQNTSAHSFLSRAKIQCPLSAKSGHRRAAVSERISNKWDLQVGQELREFE
jgi:hypothetical protein